MPPKEERPVRTDSQRCADFVRCFLPQKRSGPRMWRALWTVCCACTDCICSRCDFKYPALVNCNVRNFPHSPHVRAFSVAAGDLELDFQWYFDHKKFSNGNPLFELDIIFNVVIIRCLINSQSKEIGLLHSIFSFFSYFFFVLFKITHSRMPSIRVRTKLQPFCGKWVSRLALPTNFALRARICLNWWDQKKNR